MGSAGRSPTDRSYLSIREVLDLLVVEFPDITISKIRFLESRGLISPERTPSGYRKFYEPDVERLAWILRQQREHFLPLKVIKGRLESTNGHGAEEDEPSLFDDFAPERAPAEAAIFEEARRAGHPSQVAEGVLVAPARVPPVTPSMAGLRVAPSARRLAAANNNEVVAHAEATPPPPPPDPPNVEVAAATTGGELPPAAEGDEARPPTAAPRGRQPRRATLPAGALSAEELAAAAGAEGSLVVSLAEFGLIEGKAIAGVLCYGEETVPLVRAAAGFAAFGIEPRHLRTFKHAADRETALFGQVVTPLLLQRNPAARARATEQLEELAALGVALQAALVARAVNDLLGG